MAAQRERADLSTVAHTRDGALRGTVEAGVTVWRDDTVDDPDARHADGLDGFIGRG